MKAKLIMAVYDFSDYQLYYATFVIQGQKQEEKGLACQTLNIQTCDYTLGKEFRNRKKCGWYREGLGSKGVNTFQRICDYHLLSVLLNSIMRAKQFSSIQWVQDLHDMPQSVML